MGRHDHSAAISKLMTKQGTDLSSVVFFIKNLITTNITLKSLFKVIGRVYEWVL